jgi:hypothetical protein
VRAVRSLGLRRGNLDQAAGRYPRSFIPAPGAVLVLRGYQDNTRGHVAVVTALVSSRVIRVDQANWQNAGEVALGVPVRPAIGARAPISRRVSSIRCPSRRALSAGTRVKNY